MKTKLDLYLAVQAAAEQALDLPPAKIEAKLESVLKPLNLTRDNTAFARQLFQSRYGRMLQLRREPLDPEPKLKPAAA